jgi:hypothetical protein
MSSTNITAMLAALQGAPSQGAAAPAPSPPAASSSSSPGSFSLLSAGTTGTSVGGGTRLRLYLTDDSGSTELCQHRLGNSGDKVCFSLKKQDAETCGVNHRGDLIALEPNTLYIMAKYSPTRQALPLPKLDTV